MKIAPIDIAHKTFARKVMGLDADEVSDFLRDIADQMEELIRERNSIKEMIRQRDLQIMEYKERDETLKATIATATRMSEQIRNDAEREAHLIVGDAHQKAEMILKDSRDNLKRIYQEIAELKRTRMQFEANVRAICQSHMSMLDQSHMSMPDPQINLAAAHATATVGASAAGMGGAAVKSGVHPSAGGYGATSNAGGMHAAQAMPGMPSQSQAQPQSQQQSMSIPMPMSGLPSHHRGVPGGAKA